MAARRRQRGEPGRKATPAGPRGCGEGAGRLFPASRRAGFEHFLILIRPFPLKESWQVLQISLALLTLCEEPGLVLLGEPGWSAGTSQSHFPRATDLQGHRRDGDSPHTVPLDGVGLLHPAARGEEFAGLVAGLLLPEGCPHSRAHVPMPAALPSTPALQGAFQPFFSKPREESPASPAQQLLIPREEGQKEALCPLRPPAQPRACRAAVPQGRAGARLQPPGKLVLRQAE